MSITVPKVAQDEEEKATSGSSSSFAQKDKIELLDDDDDDLSEVFLKTLYSIFLRFSKQARESQESGNLSGKGGQLNRSNDDKNVKQVAGKMVQKCIMTEEEFDEFTKTVNGGQVMSVESKEEIKEYLDVDEEGRLTVSRSHPCSFWCGQIF